MATLEHKLGELTNDSMKQILEDINNLEKDFRKLQQSDLNEQGFLKQQVSGLNQEKLKIEQSSLLLDARVNALEHDVGFE